MAGDMKIRHLADATIDAYTYHVGRFAEFLGKELADVAQWQALEAASALLTPDINVSGRRK